uniref:Group 3 late embryogenesis abundant protein n=1 Tax=Brassica napus TaxID=3708 RepID=Q5NKG2_BRANA|nr:group 3 late embryogenesis abundant protein [Brassica napus]
MASNQQSYKAGETRGKTQQGQAYGSNEGTRAEGKAKTRLPKRPKQPNKRPMRRHSLQKTRHLKLPKRPNQQKTRHPKLLRRPKTKPVRQRTRRGATCPRPGEAIKNKAQDAAQYTKETAKGAAQYTKETAEADRDKTGGFLSQTGEHVKQIAMGAADAVKHTFGMATEEDDRENFPGTTTGTTRTTDTDSSELIRGS